jgi:hypothetical protein
MGPGLIFVRKRTFSTCGQNIRKWGLFPFFVSSYAAAEKSEWRMALKI